jgi:hypothetical protein
MPTLAGAVLLINPTMLGRTVFEEEVVEFETSEEVEETVRDEEKEEKGDKERGRKEGELGIYKIVVFEEKLEGR